MFVGMVQENDQAQGQDPKTKLTRNPLCLVLEAKQILEERNQPRAAEVWKARIYFAYMIVFWYEKKY